jgi:hypothetical protein
LRVTLCEVSAREPEPAERAGQVEGRVRTCLRQPIERSSQIIVIAIETGRPFRLGLATKLVRGFGNMRELLGMTSAERVFLAGLGEAL